MLESTKPLLVLIAVLALVALCGSAYLTWNSWQTDAIAGCTGDGVVDCDEVLNSPWSSWLGIPVGLLAMFVYSGILAVCWPVAKRPLGLASTALLCLALLAAGAAVWYTTVQAVLLNSFCIYCLGVHACGVTIAVLTLLIIRNSAGEVDYDQMRTLLGVADPMATQPVSQSHFRDRFYPWIATAAALIGLALLMGGQVLFPPESLVVESLVEDASYLTEQEEAEDLAFELVEKETETSMDLLSEEEDELFSESTSRRISFEGLKKSIDLSKHPMIGSPDAPHVFLEMVDYTCQHCRKLHPFIKATLDRYGDQIAFIIHHVPLSSRCNPNIFKDHPGKSDACDYAHLAIGVWELVPDEFPDFHDWLMESEEAPSVVAARERVIRMGGEEVLIDNSVREESGRRISEQCAAQQRLKIGLPILLTEKGLIRGIPSSEAEWFRFVEEKTGAKPVND